MTLRISRGFSRRRFLSTTGAGAIGALAMPYLIRAADRPVVTTGVQTGDLGADGGVVVKRQNLHQQGGPDLLLRVDPELRIEEACPRQAAGAAP